MKTFGGIKMPNFGNFESNSFQKYSKPALKRMQFFLRFKVKIKDSQWLDKGEEYFFFEEKRERTTTARKKDEEKLKS